MTERERPVWGSGSRRTFLRLSGAALAAAVACGKGRAPADLDIEIDDHLLRGHRLFEGARPAPSGSPEKVDALVVGGGVAGLAAAVALRDRDPVVCEVGDTLGGSSSKGRFQDRVFAQGAHYELAYPAYYGAEGLAFLESLGVIAYNGARQRWDFVDRRYLISAEREGRCWVHGDIRADVLPPTGETAEFERLLAPYEGRMPQPTRLIDASLRSLDAVSFWDFLLREGLRGTPTFKAALDYHMKDDYGAGADRVSALAGIHYYRCRPYYSEDVPLFSPPQGNAYFIDKMAARLDGGRLLTGHLVARIVPDGDRLLVDVLDLQANAIKRFQARRVVYAGQKHGLAHVFPQDRRLFETNEYAPWVVVNVLLAGRPFEEAWWQNEILGSDPRFLGFVNSAAQAGGDDDWTVLTLYYCLPPAERRALLNLRPRMRDWVAAALETVNETLGRNVGRLARKAFVKVHGHAMPIPKPNYLFRDANPNRTLPNLTYAGVDNARLPLFFEALDSGLVAANLAMEAT